MKNDYIQNLKRKIKKIEDKGYSIIHDFSKYPDKVLYSAILTEYKQKKKLFKTKEKIISDEIKWLENKFNIPEDKKIINQLDKHIKKLRLIIQ